MKEKNTQGVQEGKKRKEGKEERKEKEKGWKGEKQRQLEGGEGRSRLCHLQSLPLLA